MTNKEAIARIKDHKIVHKMNEPRAILISEALDIAIKALEQEPILDKIRAEVCDIDDNIVLNPNSLYESKVYVRFIEVLDIIDKHKAESETSE